MISRLRLAVIGSICVGIVIFDAVSSLQRAHAVEPDVVVCTQIKTAKQLSQIRQNLSGIYCLAADIDLSAIANFVPIGGNNGAPVFTGRLYGNGHVIRNLTINSAALRVGLFGIIGVDAIIQGVFLQDVTVTGTADNSDVGALAGATDGLIAGVHVSGQVTCGVTAGNSCITGGMIGNSDGTIRQSGSAAKVVGVGNYTGGLVGTNTGHVEQSYVIGAVTSNSVTGGLVGDLGPGGTVTNSYASGPVTGTVAAGGLVGESCCDNTSAAKQSYASGPVNGGNSGFVGGLIGVLGGGLVQESYSVGKVTSTGATAGGLLGIKQDVNDPAAVINCYWDTQTSGQAASPGGTGMTTADLRAALPSGFSDAWWITPTYSYPFLNDPDIDFASPLASSVVASKIFTFLPLSQLDKAQYATTPLHADADQASLATVYTIIARAIGITDNVSKLKDVKIDTYFWHDGTQTASFAGPVTQHASIGAFHALAATASLNDTNVVGALKANRLVILRGSYTKSGGSLGKHWLLATLFTSKANGATVEVVGNDPWIGEQVTIDPKTRTVTSPAGFPLGGFKVDGYQAVTFN